jgi:N-hydroxyarylamine O-acetyltransferase
MKAISNVQVTPASLSVDNKTVDATQPLSLKDRYFDRLCLNEQDLDDEPTLDKLTQIQETHLQHIPFENLAQHGCGRHACLDIEATAKKILEDQRGGFCFELNGLLAAFLLELGYHVSRVPAIVYHPDEKFDRPISHMCLSCKLQDTIYFVDAAFGEPALHPLVFEVDKEQATVEGILSRFVENEPGKIDLEWYSEEKSLFRPRIRFERDHVLSGGLDLAAFAPYLDNVFTEQSPFVQKLVCCRVTRTHKYTVAGNRLKVTTPRFGKDSTQTVTAFETDEEVRQVLWKHFGVPFKESIGLDTEVSSKAKPDLWMVL